MALFDGITINTKYGNVGFSGGKLSLGLAGMGGADTGAGLSPPTPTPLTPAIPQPMTTGIGGWIKSNPKTFAGILVGLLVAIFLIRR
jgi:hypothetical protein